jgi:alpha-1,3-mannosyltransferase
MLEISGTAHTSIDAGRNSIDTPDTSFDVVEFSERATPTASKPKASRGILGVDVVAYSYQDAVSVLDCLYDSGQTTAVAFANAHLLNCASEDNRVVSALRRFLVFNDGIGVELASRLLYGSPFPVNLNGTDFMPAFFEATATRHRVFLFGSRPQVVEKAARIFRERFPRHEVVGFLDGYRGDFAEAAAQVRASGATVVLVALGNPLQELWLSRHLGESGAALGFGVGAFFDYLTGNSRRAPEWVRRWRCEWVWRVIQEPRRMMRRYLVGNFVFLAHVLGQKLSERHSRVEAKA